MAVTILSNANLGTITPGPTTGWGTYTINNATLTAASIERSGNGNTVTLSGLRIQATITASTVQTGGRSFRFTLGVPNKTYPMVNTTPTLVIAAGQTSGVVDQTFNSDLSITVDRYDTAATIGIVPQITTALQTLGVVTTATITFSRNHPLYASVNGKSKLVQKLYYPVNGKSKEINRLYGSVNGKSRLIYQANDFGRVYYEVGTSGEIRSVELQSQAEFDSLAGTATSMSIGGGTVTVTRARGAGNNSIVGLDIGSVINATPPNFLQGCTNFTRPLTIPANVTTIGDYFMYGCTAFNSPLALPDTLATIGNSFMLGCTAFNQSLHTPSGGMPTNLTAIGNYFLTGCQNFNKPLYFGAALKTIDVYFLFGCTNFNQILRIGTQTSSAITSVGSNFMQECKAMTNQVQLYFPPGYMAESVNSFATNDSSAPCYTTGIQIAARSATHRNTFLSKFPNSTSQPYRKLR